MTDDELREIIRSVETIAVVGASASPAKPAHTIPAYLHDQSYRILPVSPKGGEMFDQPVRASVHEIEAKIDLVNVFRPPAEAEQVARDAVAVGASVLWFQPDTESDAAADVAREAGLTVVTGLCLGATHKRLGLGRRPGPVS